MSFRAAMKNRSDLIFKQSIVDSYFIAYNLQISRLILLLRRYFFASCYFRCTYLIVITINQANNKSRL